jgi:hypothetical protein
MSFVSLNQTKSFPYKEWVGETSTDEIVVLLYKEGEVHMGTGYSEIKARSKIERIAAASGHDENMNLTKMNKQLELEWVLPEGYFEE